MSHSQSFFTINQKIIYHRNFLTGYHWPFWRNVQNILCNIYTRLSDFDYFPFLPFTCNTTGIYSIIIKISLAGKYTWWYAFQLIETLCRVGLVVSVSASHTVGRGFASGSYQRTSYKWYKLPPWIARMR